MRRQDFLVISFAFFAAACSIGEARTVARLPAIDVPLWPLSTKSAEARDHVARGERYAAASYFEEAYEEFERAAAADSSLAYAWLQMSRYPSSPEEAEQNLAAAQARAADGNPIERALIAAAKAERTGDYAARLAAATELTKLAPRNPNAWWAVAGAYWGQTQEARAALRRAIEVDSGYAPVYFDLANSLARVEPKDLAEADRLVQIGVALWPQVPASYSALGYLRRAQGRLDEAIAAYTRAIELDPRNSDFYIYRANSETFVGRYERARADFDAAIRRAGPSAIIEAAVQRAQIPAYRDDPNASLAELRELESAIDGLPLRHPVEDKVTVLYAQMAIAVRHGRIDVARRADSLSAPLYFDLYGRASEGAIRLAQAAAALNHGLVAVYSGDFAAARRFADEIDRIRAVETDPNKSQASHFLRGEAARLQHDYPRALTELAQADSGGIAIGTIYSRGLVLEAMGRRAEARAAYQTVADFYFNSSSNAAVHFDAVARLAATK